MNRAMFDLQQQIFNNYVHTNVAGGTIENHTADPTIAIQSVFERTSPANNTNGKIIFTGERIGSPVEEGPTRHKKWFIDGYIQHDNTTIFDDATLLSMKAEMERVMNVYNNTINTYTYLFVDSEGWNTDPIAAIYDFRVLVTLYGAVAYS